MLGGPLQLVILTRKGCEPICHWVPTSSQAPLYCFYPRQELFFWSLFLHTTYKKFFFFNVNTNLFILSLEVFHFNYFSNLKTLKRVCDECSIWQILGFGLVVAIIQLTFSFA